MGVLAEANSCHADEKLERVDLRFYLADLEVQCYNIYVKYMTFTGNTLFTKI